ncbi:MAG: zinc ribbon domain-containing protein [Desulfatibacillaceae bacterium]
MKEQIATLVELQGIDDEATAVRQRMETCTQRVDAVQVKLDAVSEKLEAAREAKAGLMRKQRELEVGIEDNNALTKKSEERLMTIKNNREYRALLREVEDSKKRTTDMEDQLVEIMDQIDAADKAIAALEEEFKALSDELASEKKDVRGEIKDCEKRLAAIEKERRTLSEKMKRSIYKKYALILDYKQGKAVVPVTDFVCKGCNMSIPPQTYNELQKEDAIMFCPHCERIIYYLESA